MNKKLPETKIRKECVMGLEMQIEKSIYRTCAHSLKQPHLQDYSLCDFVHLYSSVQVTLGPTYVSAKRLPNIHNLYRKKDVG